MTNFQQVDKSDIEIPTESELFNDYSTMRVRTSKYWKVFARWKKKFKKLNQELLIGLSSEERDSIYQYFFKLFYHWKYGSLKNRVYAVFCLRIVILKKHKTWFLIKSVLYYGYIILLYK